MDLDVVSMSQSNTNRDEALSAFTLGFVMKSSKRLLKSLSKKIRMQPLNYYQNKVLKPKRI
jgi:Holliday junction DNA helicase RuvA